MQRTDWKRLLHKLKRSLLELVQFFFLFFIKWMSCGPWCIFVWVDSLMLWCIYTMVLKCMEHRDDLWLFSTIKIPIPMYNIPYVIFKVSKIFNEWDGNSCWHGHIIMKNYSYMKMILTLIAYCLYWRSSYKGVLINHTDRYPAL